MQSKFTKHHPKIVAVIPCFNTEQTIGEVVVNAQKYVDEVIVVDDGSSDNTTEAARNSGAIIIKHDKNRGKGAVMKNAAKIADCDILVFIDGDGQHDAEEIPKLLKPIIEGKADFVIGSRFSLKSTTLNRPLLRNMANKLASFIISFIISFLQPIARIINRNSGFAKNTKGKEEKSNNISYVKSTGYRVLSGRFKWVSDCTSGFTAMKRDNWETLDLISDGFQIETEMIFEQAKNGYVIAEVPITCLWNGSSSKLSIMKDGFNTLILLIRKLFIVPLETRCNKEEELN